MTITLIHKSNTIRVTDELLSINKRFCQVFLTSEHVLTGDGEPSLLGATQPFYEPVPMGSLMPGREVGAGRGGEPVVQHL